LPGLLPESTSQPAREPHSTTESTSSEEKGNRKFELVGNPVRDPSYRVRKSGKKIADFVLATHPEEEKTEYWRIRAFDNQAERVRDQVRKGQTGVEVTVYGPKQWKTRKKTKEGSWEETAVTGYYAGFVKVPKQCRDTEQKSS
jgi:membrane-bound lytic murein transglycosylase